MTSATVVIPTRGGAARLPRLLGALRAQTHDDWDAIVVIDGDIDASEQVVAAYSDLPIQTVVFPTNRGRVEALNTGFRMARGEVLIRSDDDFEPAPTHITAHVEGHTGGPCGVIGLPINVAPDSAYMRAYGSDADSRSRQAAYAADPMQRWKLWGGNTSVDRGTFDRVGGFDERYQGYGWEDLDFGYRLHELGVPIVLSPDAEVRHHMAAVTTAIRAERAYWSGQARHRFEQIHGAGTSGWSPQADSSWGRLTRLAGDRMTPSSTRHAARLVDAALPVLPTPIGRKSVAFVVESAGVAGYLRHEQTQ